MKPNPLLATALMSAFTAVLSPSARAQPARAIPGYAMSRKTLAKTPYSLAELESLQMSLLFSDENLRYPCVRDGQF